MRYAVVGGDRRAALLADFSLLGETVAAALEGRQPQPILK